jgi:MoaA/NifB/PqqE/SkfB family radical SAM enzyme
MCYYTYDQSDWSKPLEEVQNELRAALERGNTSVDFTGGEPTIYPQMAEVIRYAESIGLHTCIITNGLAFEKVKKLAEAGCTEWLLSIHGFEEQQDKLLNVQGAWDKMNRTARYLNESSCFIRVNCTLTRYNFKDLPKLAAYYASEIGPRVVNFINFNPHYEWGRHEQPETVKRLNEVQVCASEVAPWLKQALDYLNERKYWVNVRYFPLCLLKGYEHHVCNNPQVMFDPYEWDYGVFPKTAEAYLKHGREFQKRINTMEGACASCGMIDVCGGLHGNYAQLHGFSELDPYSETSDYPYQFKTDLAADIIIPAFRPSEKLGNLLSEITGKTVPPYNLIMVTRQQSAAKNRNEGLRASQNPYVIMCDDDISGLPPGWNRDLIYRLRENRELFGISARLMNSDGTAGRNSANHFDMAPPLPKVDMIPTACCVFRKTDLRFDARYIRAGWEDTDFFMHAIHKYGDRFAIANTIRVQHLNEEKNGGGVENEHNRELFYSKWNFAEPDGLDQQNQYDRSSPDSCGTVALNPPPGLRALYESVMLDPTDMDVFRSFIHESYKSRCFHLIESCLEELLKTRSSSKELCYLLASCLFEQAKYDEARPVAADLASRYPGYAPARSLLELIETMGQSGATGVPSATNGNSGIAGEANGSAKVCPAEGVSVPGPYPRIKLLVGPGLMDPLGNEAFLIKALKRAADVVTFDHNHQRFEEVLRAFPAGWTPDAVLVRDAEYYKIPPGLEAAEYPVFCLLGDYNLSLNQMLPVMGAFDHFFCDLKGVRIFKDLGLTDCEYFCLYGFDPEVHRPFGRQKEWDVLFVGNLNHQVQQEREQHLYRLARLADKYRVHIGTGIFGAEYARMLASSILVFNQSIRDEANMRFFEALACGAFVLNPRLEELDLLGFSPNEHYLAYESLEDAVNDYFQCWPESRKREAAEKSRLALEQHSYEARAFELIRKIAGIEVDISKRPLRHLPGEQIQARWDMHHCEHTDMAGLGRVGRYDPKMVIWQTHLVNNDLEIRNFDFSMWVWWVNLLRAAGLRSYLARFLDEKGRLLESFACYRKVADQIGEWKREIDPMVPTTLINETNFRESDRGGTSWG